MKRIGLIGGLSWESSAEYYRLLNQIVREKLGGMHSADCVMTSFDFAEIEALQAAGEWDAAARLMVDAAHRLERAGAECIVICSNTMHRMAGEVQAAVDIPLIHIADPTARAAMMSGHETVGLLATIYTMEQEFYRSRLTIKHGLSVIVPEDEDRQTVNRIIYGELVRGKVRRKSRAQVVAVIEKLHILGAQAIILGCTELGLLVKPEHSPLPLYDTTALHARAVVNFAIGEASEGI
ncbi:MAG: aspartate/glutamate racemase family protein [Chloroflexi bacterium]|nr:putative racemase YgeA [Anaerolineae bacterium]MCC6564672.1 aspartate/glutamate racemase family protein [Chloroflexota bacterium]MDL1916722.1 aspartate/glutamate racemase family protein [Anaerolineae bacterium CFX4]OQY82840.1 MAG: aspartate racemase [Anaerolineae bacterium UTCFX5]MBW7880438.1 aspartate/glutamate racemase family protein [Anaerolineae bacterium]